MLRHHKVSRAQRSATRNRPHGAKHARGAHGGKPGFRFLWQLLSPPLNAADGNRAAESEAARHVLSQVDSLVSTSLLSVCSADSGVIPGDRIQPRGLDGPRQPSENPPPRPGPGILISLHPGDSEPNKKPGDTKTDH